MSTVAIDLPDDLLSYVHESLDSGRSADQSQVIQKALRLLKAVETRQSALDAAIQEGLDAESRSDFEDIDDVEAWFEDLRKEWA
jgi:putative addiction module CopG family antidote